MPLIDIEIQCAVTLKSGNQCSRSLNCKAHSMSAKRAVPGRSAPFDALLRANENDTILHDGGSLVGPENN